MNFFITLRQRLLLLTLLPSTLIAIALVAYFTYSGINTLESELRNKGLATVRYLAPISEYSIISGQSDNLHALAQVTVQDSGVKAAIITNQKGRPIAVSGRVSLSVDVLRQAPESPRLVTENDRWLAFGAPVIRSLNESDSLFDPIGPAGAERPPEVVGYVFVEFDKSELALRQQRLFQRGLSIVLIGLVILAGLAIAIADTLARPLHRLVLAVREMSSGRFDTRVPAASSGELGILEHGFNDMAEHIEDVHRSMQSRIEEATAQLAFQARHDPLTGLINRREFEHRLERALLSVQAGGEEFSLLFIDLDRFKPVNDSCGHLAGDELLRQIAQLFLGRLREEDTLARLGGDEFGIILANCSGSRARQVADDLCSLTGAYRFIWQDKVFAIGASIGLTPVNRLSRNVTEVLAASDAACYRAKESGRNQVCEQGVLQAIERRQETGNWAGRISLALINDRLIIEAQPLLSLQKDNPGGHLVELGARLNEPGQAPIALSALMDAAERYDLAGSIDLRFIDCAIGALARARQKQRTLRCLVPISRTSLGQSSIVEHIARSLAAHGLDGQGFCLLFPEDAPTHMSSQLPDFLRQLRALGCQVALADFGGGLSSFSHLHSIGPNYIKLSTSLTRELGGSRGSTALLRAVQEITADQGIYAIAEGIHDVAAIEHLKTLGISYAEGKAAGPCEPFEVWLEGAVLR